MHNVIRRQSEIVGKWLLMDFVSFRAEKSLRREAELLAELESRDLSDEFRDIFKTGTAEKRKLVALDKYAKGDASFGKAAEIAGISTWEFAELLEKRGLELNLSAEQVLKAAEKIRF